jgi:hypothetical protein
LGKIKGFYAFLFVKTGASSKDQQLYFTGKSQYISWFHNFSRNNFQFILKLFNLNDDRNLTGPGEPCYDHCAKIQSLIHQFSRVV